MIFETNKIIGSFVIQQQPITDSRGFFARAFCSNEFKKAGLVSEFVQSNISFNHKQRTTRGLHYQIAPYQEDKLITCMQGAIFDAIVDLRPESTTYLQWFGIELNESNRYSLYIPKGCAHGYQTLTDNALVHYQVSQFYTPAADRAIAWDDKLININWPFKENIIISDKDKAAPHIQDLTF